MSDEQSFAGLAGRETGNDEFNRLDFLVRRILNGLCTITLVKVVAVNGQAIDVQPLVGQLDGARNVVEHGIINDVPFMRYQAGANAVIMDPVVGDLGIVGFAQSDVSTAVSTKDLSPPGSLRKFDWADALYLGGVASMLATPTQFIRIDDDGVTITSTSDVTINASGTVTINAASKVVGDLEVTGQTKTGTLSIGGADYAGHRHIGVTTGGGTSGVVAP